MKTLIDNQFNRVEFATYCKNVLVHDVLAFWLAHGIDKKNGGIYTGLDRDGTIIETDKSIWFQGRALWSFATAYLLLAERGENHPEYLDACESLAIFIEKHATDSSDGRMYFRVTDDGKPVIKRIRYYFSETFAAIGLAAYARATGMSAYAEKAFQLFNAIEKIRSTHDVLVPKFNAVTRPSRGFGEPMILLNTAAELRASLPEKKDFFNNYIDALINEIETYFVRPELKAVLEQCAPDGSVQHEHFEGRQLNPGHAIEGAWFIMKEGLARKSEKLMSLGLNMFTWMWERGWDKEYGGIIYFRDIDGKPGNEYWHDMKFWWPQCEAIIASLYAYAITSDVSYFNKFASVYNYFHKHFPDDEYGECFGYLHRDGTLSTPVKGNMYKGPFHIPRMYMECICHAAV